MAGFTPFKRHANPFNYVPRYFDPEQDARDQRRAELTGVSREDEGEYNPGKYIRTQRDARAARNVKREGDSRVKIVMMAGFAILAVLLAMVAYPKLMALVEMNAEQQQEEPFVEEFDPYAPIVVVPNDYVEEE